MVVFLAKVDIAYGSSDCHGNAMLSVRLDVQDADEAKHSFRNIDGALLICVERPQ